MIPIFQNRVSVREEGLGKGIKSKREKKAKKGRKRGGKEERGRYDSTEKIAK